LRIRLIFNDEYVLNTPTVMGTNESYAAAPGTWIPSVTLLNTYYKAVPPVMGNPPAMWSASGAGYFYNRSQAGIDTPVGGSITAGTWFWGDVDGLGFNTVYLRDTADADPNGFIHRAVAHYSIETTYAVGVIRDLSFAQQGDVLYIFCPTYGVRTLTRTAHLTWTLALVTWPIGVTQPGNVTAPPALGVAPFSRYVYTAVSDYGEESVFRRVITGVTEQRMGPGGFFTWSFMANVRYFNVYKEYPVNSDLYYWHGRALNPTAGVVVYHTDDAHPDMTMGPPIAHTPFNVAGDTRLRVLFSSRGCSVLGVTTTRI
jgi:hypothetical protein